MKICRFFFFFSLIFTEKVYLKVLVCFVLFMLSILVICRNFGWTSNHKCFSFKEYERKYELVLQKTARNTHISLNAIHSLIMAMIIKDFNHKEQPLVDELLAMGGN